MIARFSMRIIVPAGLWNVASLRARINEKVAAYQVRTPATDLDGRVFLKVWWFFVLALLVRYTFVMTSAVPTCDPQAATSLMLCAAMLTLSMATARCGHAEATLLLRAGAVGCSAVPWTLSACGLIFNAGRHNPFVDDTLALVDRSLGFDWMQYVLFVDARPLLWSVLWCAYRSIFFQLQFICVVLAFTRAPTRLYALLCSQFLSLGAVACFAILTPAVGAYLHFGSLQTIAHIRDFTVYADVAPTITWLRGEAFAGARDLPPLITFPSYHASCAVVFAWALWKTPYVRWLGLILNGGMLAATPVMGSHYFIDVIFGGAFGATAAVFAEGLIGHLAHQLPRRAASSEAEPGAVPAYVFQDAVVQPLFSQ